MATRESPRATLSPDRRRVDLRLIADEAHYREIIERGLLSATTSIWISTANVKDVQIEAAIGTRARTRKEYRSLFEWLKSKADVGLDVRVLHAAAPSRVLAANHAWKTGSELHRLCPRVHLKMVAVDGALLYLGSANFTGAGLGAKADGRRNFEAGIVTDDPLMLDELQRVFDDIWMGKRCTMCRLRKQCPLPLDAIEPGRSISSRRTPASRAVKGNPPRKKPRNLIDRPGQGRSLAESPPARRRNVPSSGR